MDGLKRIFLQVTFVIDLGADIWTSEFNHILYMKFNLQSEYNVESSQLLRLEPIY